MVNPTNILVLGIDAELDISARPGAEAILLDSQVARHQREEIAGLGDGILPHSIVPRQ